MSSENKIRLELETAATALQSAFRSIDDSTEYLEDELAPLLIQIKELQKKMTRDAALQRDREAFAEPSAGLKEWLGG